MKITSANFVLSSPKVALCPKPDKPEYAFIGRSNVGKSSLINALVNRKDLAKTSGKPGKTRLINHFLVNGSWFLVDLPGYGFAKVEKKTREGFEPMIGDYLKGRTNLLCTFVLIDMRHEPQGNDLSFMEWMAENELPFAMVFTKSDKLKPAEEERKLDFYKQSMRQVWSELPPYFITSAEKRRGMDDVLKFIEETNQIFVPPAPAGKKG